MKTNQEYMSRYEFYDMVERKSPSQAVIEAFFTTNDGNLYAILPAWPGKEFVIHDVASAVGVTLLGTGAPLRWQQEGNGIRITMPDFPPHASDAYTLRVAGAR
jgi:hypothetical protein